MIVWLAVGCMAGGWLLIERGYPLPGFVLAGAGAWLGIWWAALLVTG